MICDLAVLNSNRSAFVTSHTGAYLTTPIFGTSTGDLRLLSFPKTSS